MARKLIPLFVIVALIWSNVAALTSSEAAAPIESAPSAQAAAAPSGAPSPFLTGPSSAKPLDIALGYLRSQKARLGLSDGDIDELVVTDQYTSKHNGVTHIYLQQRHEGIGVYNALINFNIMADGRIVSMGNRAVSNVAEAINTTKPALTAEQAIRTAATRLKLATNAAPTILKPQSGTEQAGLFSPAGISQNAIPVKLTFHPVKADSARLAWNMAIYQLDSEHWWDLNVDAETGEILSQVDWVISHQWEPAHAHNEARPLVVEAPAQAHPAHTEAAPAGAPEAGSYNVFPLPGESPNHIARTVVTNPDDALASPFGWHDTNGAAGAEYTITRGNNAHAYLDPLNANMPTILNPEPDGGPTLTFNFPLNLAQEPSTYTAAATVNLFYWNNIVHDLNYHYGFDEVSGNFQENNYGRGGLGTDYVFAEAQDKRDIGNRNNANFATPPDGQNPRMQMFLWNQTTPERDGDLDAGVILHEYGHGISNRLTGGPSNTSCLGNAEQMGEGWSDWQTMVFTARATDTATQARGVGSYAMGQPTTGPGIRAFPYSTSMVTDPRTYNTTRTAAVPHGVGSTWTAMLWEVYWNLVNAYGFDTNLYTGTGGNNLAIQLINDGMKFQPCNPGFIDGRDAILAADAATNGGANACLIWQGFAKRGLGFSAVQGSSNSNSDNTEAFDLPSYCQAPDFVITSQPASATVCAPASATFTQTLVSTLGFAAPVTLAADVPPGYTPVFTANPVTPSGTSILTVMNTGAVTPGTYNVVVSANTATRTHTVTNTMTIYTVSPVAVPLVSPADGATNQSAQPTLTWSAVPQATSYLLQVSTDPAFGTTVYSATVNGTSHAVAETLEANTVYYWRVRTDNTCGTGVWSQVFDFTTAPLPASCAVNQATNVAYQSNFESGAAGWSQGLGSVGNTWALSSARTWSGTQAWHATNPGSLSDQRLVSPAIALPDAAASPISLRYRTYQAFEVPNSDGRCWDAGILEISNNSGVTWNQVPNSALLTDPYDSTIWNDQPGNNPLGGVPAWCPNPPPQNWLVSVVDLNAYAGQTVQFRFRLGSDGSVGNEGWYIDDVSVQSCAVPTNISVESMAATTPTAPSTLSFFAAVGAMVGLVGLSLVLRRNRQS